MRMIQLPWQVTRQMFLSEDEVDRLLGHLSQMAQRAESGEITEYVDEVIVQSLLFSGLRNSEFCRLTLADTFMGTRKSVFQVLGTPREDRDVVIPRTLNDLVRRFVAEIRPNCLREGESPRDLALP